MPLRRVHLEVGLLTASTARLAYELAALGGRGPGPQILAASLLALGAPTLVLEFARGERAALALALSPGPPYSARRADSPGLALGALAAPSVLAALAAAVNGGGGSGGAAAAASAAAAPPWLEWLQASVVGTLLALMALAASTRALGPGWERLPPARARRRGGGGSDDEEEAACAGDADHARLSAAAARAAASRAPFTAGEVAYMAACAASAALAMLPVASKGAAAAGAAAATAPSSSASATMAAEAALLAAVAGIPLATHAVMRLLPGCFSLGEGLALGQGLAAVLVGAAVQAPLAARAFVPPGLQAAAARARAWAASAAAFGSAAASAAAAGPPPPPAWVFAAAAPAPATALPAFVVTLLAATLALAACAALLSPWLARAAGLAAQAGQGEEEAQAASEGEDGELEQDEAPSPARRRRRPQEEGKEKQQEQPSPPRTRARRPPPPPPPLAPLPLRLGALALALAASAHVLLLARWTLSTFLPAGGCRRAGLLAYWAAVLGVSLPAMGFAARLRRRSAAAGRGARGGRGGRGGRRQGQQQQAPPLLPRILLRKGYHLVALALFLPAFYADLPLLCVALAIAFAALVAAEGVRVGGAAALAAAAAAPPRAGASRSGRPPAPPFLPARLLARASSALQGFMGGFIDARDAGGAVYVTHFTLLLGIALPIWLAVCALPPALRAVRADGASLQALAPRCLLLALPPSPDAGIPDPCAGSEHAAAARWLSAALGPRGRGLLRGARGAAAALCRGGGLSPSSSPLAAALPSLADLLDQERLKRQRQQQGFAAAANGTAMATTATAIKPAPAQLVATPLAVTLTGLAGAAIIGVGDTAASAVGRLLGRVPVHAGSCKTVEGTAAGVICTLLAWAPLVAMAAGGEGGGAGGGAAVWGGVAAATLGAGLLEAATSQLDNLLIPLYYMPHLLLAVRPLS